MAQTMKKMTIKDEAAEAALRKVIQARSNLILDEPFFGTLALKLDLTPDPTCKSFWTDGKRIGFNPTYVNSQTLAKTQGLVCEEVMHNADGHPWRRDGRDLREWNEACLALGTRIEMADGSLLPVEQVPLGAYVASPMGPSKVLGVVFSGMEYVVPIYNKHNVLYCTVDHPILSAERGLIYAKSQKYPKRMSSLQRGIQSPSGRRRVRFKALQNNVSGRLMQGDRRRLLERGTISIYTRPNGRSLYHQALECTRFLETISNRISISSWNYRRRGIALRPGQRTLSSTDTLHSEHIIRPFAMAQAAWVLWCCLQERQRESLFSYQLVWLYPGRIVAVDSTVFNNQGTSCDFAFTSYLNKKAAIAQKSDDGSYAANCLRDSAIEQTRLTVGRRSKTPWPVFDLITEKTFVFAENIIVHNCDYALMPIILAAKMQIPDDSCYDPRFDGMSAEQVYALRQQERQPQGQKGGGDQEKEGDQDSGQEEKSKQPPEQDEGDEEKSQESSGEDEEERESNKPMSGGEVRDCEDEDAATQEAEWQVATLQAAQAAKAQGKLPAGIERLVDEIRRPKIDWKAALRRFVQTCAKADYTWRQPNRRYIASGIYLPALRSEQMPPMVIYWDTSGSRDSEEARAECAAEVVSVIEEVKPERIYVIYGDTEFQHVDEFEPGDLVEFHPKGGGGTDFTWIPRWIEAHEIEPACLIGITDGWGTWPKQEPEFPTLWAITTDVIAPFGETLKINGD